MERVGQTGGLAWPVMALKPSLEAVFTRKRQAHPSVKPIFDGAAEAMKCYARWTIRLLTNIVRWPHA